MNDELMEAIHRMGSIRALEEKIYMRDNPAERFTAIRAMYKILDPEEFEPYPVDWSRVFTPIEQSAWSDLRCAGINMWPQFPVGRYFLDFADPAKLIAIECDGKQWHDPERDAKRDAELGELGWIVYRIPGSDCMRVRTPYWDEVRERIEQYGEESVRDGIIDWLENTSEGFVAALGVIEYGHSAQYFTQGDAWRAVTKRAKYA